MSWRGVEITLMAVVLLAVCGVGPGAAQAAGDQSIGSVSLAVDGAEKSFDYLPESGSMYTKLSSSIAAHPESGSKEMLTITFFSIDLKEHEYPADLPLPKNAGKPMSPMAAMASVGFSYIDADGVEWAGPGKVRVESFDGTGVIQGTFDQVTLPHTDKEHPDITLTAGTFRARITSPW